MKDSERFSLRLNEMVWFWGWHGRLIGEPDVTYLERRSGASFWRIQQTGDTTEFEFSVPDTSFFEVSLSLEELSKYKIVPDSQVAIARAEALAWFLELPDTEVDFHKVILVCKDGESHDFSFVRPKKSIACTDVSKFDVEWVRENEFYVRWRKLKLLSGCMGGASIAREKYNRKMVVSEKIQKELKKIDPKGVDFFEAEGSHFGPRV